MRDGNLVHAMRELASGPPAPVDARPAHRVLLRARATTVAAARALEAARAALESSRTGGGGGAGELVVEASAPDELIASMAVAAADDVSDAVSRLVRASSSLAQVLAAGLADVVLALVVADHDPLEAVVRAGALATAPGLLVLDDAAWAAGGARLAAVPGLARAVDPTAPFGQNRWELSALLVRPPLFGRDQDVERLSRVLVDPSDAPVLVALHGPAGVGKTALVRAALTAAGFDDGSAPVLWGAADTLQPTSYAAVTAMVRALAGAPAGHPRAAARLRVLVQGLAGILDEAIHGLRDSALVSRLDGDVVGPDGPLDGPAESEPDELLALLPVLVTLLGAGDDDDDVMEERSPRALRVALKRALYLIAAALLANADDGRPAVFVVPGAEALDGATRDALAFTAARLRGRVRVVLLSASRLRLPASFEDGFRVERMEVRGLSAPASRAIVGALLDRPDSDALGPLVERARGSPLALIHAVRFAVEGGLLRRRDDSWDTSELEPRDIPGRLDRLLRGRAERLPADARRLLAGCATLGFSFLPETVELVGVRLGISRDDVKRGLSFLVDTGFLVRRQPRPGAPLFPDAVDDEVGLAFEHPLLRAAAEASIPDDERRALHGIVADALEAAVPAGLHAQASALARHHRLADRPRDALERLAIAARRSARLDDKQGALALAHEGVELAGDDAAAAFPFHLELLGLKESGPRGAQRDALRELVRTAERAGEPRLLGQALVRVARFNVAAGDAAMAEAAAVGALVELRRGPRPRNGEVKPSRAVEQSALRMLSLARFHRGDFRGARAALQEARVLSPASDRRALAMIEQQEGLLLLEEGAHAAAVERLLIARAHRVASSDVGGEAACLDAIASAYARMGRVATARALLEMSGRLRDRIGDQAGRAWGQRAEAELCFAAGDDDAARRIAEAARAAARTLGLEHLDTAASLLCARVLLRRGDVDAADTIVEGVRRRAKDTASAAEASLLAARVRIARAIPARGSQRERTLKIASARAKHAVELADARGFLAVRVQAMAAVGEVLLLEGAAAAALPWAQQAAELLDDPAAWSVPAEEVLGVHARVLEAMGDDEDAGVARARARSIADARASSLRVPRM